jgi:hypothetical protein
MTRMKQINIDGSRLQGVDLSQVPNQKIKMPKAASTQLNVVESAFTRASISTAAAVSNAGKWATIPQDFGSGSLAATMVVPTSTPTPGPSTGGPLAIRPKTMAVTFGLTAVVVVGVNMDGGAYWEAIPNNFGLLGCLSFAGSTSLGVSGAVDVLMVDGPISLLDGLGITIIVDIGVSKTLFIGMGILVVLPSWKVVGYVMEFGGGSSIGPPITLNVQLGYGGHIQVL